MSTSNQARPEASAPKAPADGSSPAGSSVKPGPAGSRRRWWVMSLFGLGALAAAAALAMQSQRAEETEPDTAQQAAASDAPAPAGVPLDTAPAVTVVRAELGEVSEQVIVSGTLVPKEEILIAPEVDGLAVTEILVEEGDRVAKGQVLARLSRAPLEAQIAQIDAQIARAQAAIAQAGVQIKEAEATREQNARALERAMRLNKSGYATDERLDQSLAAAEVADARVASAREAVAVAEADKAAAEAQRREIAWRLARTDVKAPAAGVISRRYAKIGQIAGMAAGPLFTLIEDGTIELEASVADVDIMRLQPGQPASVLPAGLSEPISGSVRLIAPEVDRLTRLGSVRISLQSDRRLVTGAFARGTVEIGKRSGVTLPLSAIAHGADGASVQVVTGDRVHRRPVTIGLTGIDRVEIVSGLAAGETVIAKAGSFLREGDRVRPMTMPHKEAMR